MLLNCLGMIARNLLVLIVAIYTIRRLEATCDCELGESHRQVSPKIIDRCLLNKKKVDRYPRFNLNHLVFSVEKRFQRLYKDNMFKLEWLQNSKRTSERLAEESYKMSDHCARKGQFHCRDSGECIHPLLGFDGIVDCQDGSDEADHICVNPMKVGVMVKAILPKSQTCFPTAITPVIMTGLSTVTKQSHYLPQFVMSDGFAEYAFKDSHGRRVTGELQYKKVLSLASRNSTVWFKNDEYHFKVESFLAYYTGSYKSTTNMYTGKSLDRLCSSTHFIPDLE